MSKRTTPAKSAAAKRAAYANHRHNFKKAIKAPGQSKAQKLDSIKTAMWIPVWMEQWWR